MGRSPRILLYSHDTYGLGHLRRTLSVADRLYHDVPAVHQLVLTGSMVAGAFALPPRLDLVKLPALSKRSSGTYKSRALPISLKTTLRWREQMILQAAQTFQPDLLLVDKVAGGVYGELLPTLRYLKTWLPKTKLVLGMRDIEDGLEATRTEWAANEVYWLLDNVYDCILLYGQRDVFDPVQAYGMSQKAAAKLVVCGYLRRTNGQRDPEVVRRELDIASKPLVVVTVGGGGDGYEIISTYLEMLAARAGEIPYHSLVVTGPLMSKGRRVQLKRMAADLPLSLMEFTADLISYLAVADLVVSMAGYNTVCEILSLQKRALLIPRMNVRAEQQIRAEALARRDLARVLWPVDLTANELARNIDVALAAPPPRVDLSLGGLESVGQAINGLLAESRHVVGTNGHRKATDLGELERIAA